jgi:trimeric autotransporter adhesin
MRERARGTLHKTAFVLLTAALALAAPSLPMWAQQAAQPKGCVVNGKAMSGTIALPGVALVVRAGETIVAATSTESDGTYRLVVPPATGYKLTAELTGFGKAEQDLVLSEPAETTPCAAKADLELVLVRGPVGAASSGTAPAGPATASPTAGARFEALTVQADATGAAGLAVTPPDREQTEAAIRALLPPGFTTEIPTEAVMMTGNMASIDRGMLNDRMQAIGRGEFDPVTGQFAAVLGPDGQPLPGQGPGGRGLGPGGRGGPGGPGRGGPGGPGGRGGALGGRGVQQRLYNMTSNYSFGGSALDSAPYQLRSDSPAEKRPYSRQNFGMTVGGPVKIPGAYDGTRRTNFTLSYTGSRGGNLFDQYATVPTDAIRAGDFSSVTTPIINPTTGEPFDHNQIPPSAIHPGAAALLRFLPSPNLPGTTRNLHVTTTTQSTSDSINLRVTHNFTAAAGRGAPGGRGGGGRVGGPGGRAGGPAGRGLSVNMNAALQYRRNDNDSPSVFQTLGGRSEGSSITVPIGLNIQRARQTHAINVNVARSTSNSVNRYAFLEDVAGSAGIQGVSTDPFSWGVPTLNFSTFSDLRDMTPSRRSDTRLSATYAWTRPALANRHTFRIGGDFRQDWSSAQTDANARGEFIFTGLYAAGGAQVPRNAGFDFADFLLGMPQQASINYGPGNVRMRGRGLSAYFQDDWRVRGNLTLNVGIRYELIWPYLETNGHMVNLDVNPDFTAAAPVTSGADGAFTGSFPAALMHLDANNIAPRAGFAWAARPGLIVRGGYGISYNAGSYATIARQLVAQPPFAVASTSIGTATSPLDWSNPFVAATPTTTTNNFGVDRDYVLGKVQTWNGDVSTVVGQVWDLGAGYTGTRGSSLDMVRAPNRGPTGLRIPDVQAFTWQTSEAASQLHAGTFRVARRPVRGLGAGLTYTLAKSRDNASTLGGGRTTVAQDDQNLDAEWGLSSFDRRHQISANASLELPFGPNRRWLNGGGVWARLLENWRANTTFTWQSGAPFTPTISGAAADVARGTNGTLRANYNGQPIQLGDPTIDLFFNTSAFSIPEAGTYGSAGRNIIIGPGSKSLNASFARDIRLSGNRSISLNLNATNLLNLVQYTGINTNVNSPSFGQITSVRPMRSMTLNINVRF